MLEMVPRPGQTTAPVVLPVWPVVLQLVLEEQRCKLEPLLHPLHKTGRRNELGAAVKEIKVGIQMECSTIRITTTKSTL